MLSSMAKEHQAKQQKHKQNQEVRRKEAIEASNELTKALVDHLNVGVAQAYLNQRRLDAEAKQLQAASITFTKQAQQWMHMIGNFSSALKELGDVENWSRAIETDVYTVQKTVELAYRQSKQTSDTTSADSSCISNK